MKGPHLSLPCVAMNLPSGSHATPCTQFLWSVSSATQTPAHAGSEGSASTSAERSAPTAPEEASKAQREGARTVVDPIDASGVVGPACKDVIAARAPAQVVDLVGLCSVRDAKTRDWSEPCGRMSTTSTACRSPRTARHSLDELDARPLLLGKLLVLAPGTSKTRSRRVGREAPDKDARRAGVCRSGGSAEASVGRGATSAFRGRALLSTRNTSDISSSPSPAVASRLPVSFGVASVQTRVSWTSRIVQ